MGQYGSYIPIRNPPYQDPPINYCLFLYIFFNICFSFLKDPNHKEKIWKYQAPPGWHRLVLVTHWVALTGWSFVTFLLDNHNTILCFHGIKIIYISIQAHFILKYVKVTRKKTKWALTMTKIHFYCSTSPNKLITLENKIAQVASKYYKVVFKVVEFANFQTLAPLGISEDLNNTNYNIVFQKNTFCLLYRKISKLNNILIYTLNM